MLRDLAALARQWDRGAVTVVVEAGHIGPMLLVPHPTRGRSVECSWAQAQQLHGTVPLRLVRVVDRDTAHFAAAWCCVVPTMLPRPPYDDPAVGRGKV